MGVGCPPDKEGGNDDRGGGMDPMTQTIEGGAGGIPLPQHQSLASSLMLPHSITPTHSPTPLQFPSPQSPTSSNHPMSQTQSHHTRPNHPQLSNLFLHSATNPHTPSTMQIDCKMKLLASWWFEGFFSRPLEAPAVPAPVRQGVPRRVHQPLAVHGFRTPRARGPVRSPPSLVVRWPNIRRSASL